MTPTLKESRERNTSDAVKAKDTVLILITPYINQNTFPRVIFKWGLREERLLQVGNSMVQRQIYMKVQLALYIYGLQIHRLNILSLTQDQKH